MLKAISAMEQEEKIKALVFIHEFKYFLVKEGSAKKTCRRNIRCKQNGNDGKGKKSTWWKRRGRTYCEI